MEGHRSHRQPTRGAVAACLPDGVVARRDASAGDARLPAVVSPDRVASLAAPLAGAPAAVFTVIEDDHERVAGRWGEPTLSWPGSAPVASGPAACVVGTDGPVSIEDATADLRWGCCPVVVSAGIRALLGVPVRGAGTRITGVLYALDPRPRTWTPEQIAAVQGLAALVECQQIVQQPAADESAVSLRDAVRPTSETDVQHRFLTALLETVDVGVVACDEAGRLVLYNRALRELRGLPSSWSPADGLARSMADSQLLSADGEPLTIEQTPLLRALRGEMLEQTDVTLKAPGRRMRMATANAKPIYAADGRRIGAVAAYHDVTDRRRAERFADCELQVARALTDARSVSEAGPAVLEAVARSLQWPHAELWLTSPDSDRLDPVAHWTSPTLELRVDLPQVTEPTGIVGSVWASGRPLWVPDLLTSPYLSAGEAAARTLECADQGLRTVLATPLRDDRTVLGVLVCFADAPEDGETLLTTLLGTIAHQIGQFIARRRADELALELARTKDQFIALVSHEMRTPLTAISTYTELILTDPEQACTGQQRMLIERIDRNTRSLRTIIDDLLDLAALESGRLTITRDDMELIELIEDAVAAAEPAARAAGVHLRQDLPGRLHLVADPNRLRQVLDNLLSNAIKYSPHGGTVQVRVEADGEAIRLTVSDTGIGIPPAERPRLFHRFYRTATARSHGIPGTGLGLTIVRAIVEAHDGTIRVADTPGAGMTMEVRLPMVAAEETHAPADSDA